MNIKNNNTPKQNTKPSKLSLAMRALKYSFNLFDGFINKMTIGTIDPKSQRKDADQLIANIYNGYENLVAAYEKLNAKKNEQTHSPRR